eukprot:gb/GECH01012597.1/.p1 GENE.gb/GECH01012597.1/~~gb/GECH01012597.1/.p1  ORF type:complete len:148 (+),score=39.95 gb/GECH01012597.1/:1-444(+)
MMSNEKLNECKEAFALYDRTGEGFIATSDIGTVMRSLGQNPTQSQVQTFMQEADPQNEGRINFNTFSSIMEANMKDSETIVNEILEAFRTLDKDQSGQLPAVYLRHLMTSVGEKLPESQVDQLLKYADVDEQGNINYEQFVRSLMVF